MTKDWKSLSRDAAKAHNEQGGVVMLLNGPPLVRADCLVNISKDPLVVVGKVLCPKKDIRSWLWKRRAARLMGRPGAVLWTAFDGVASYLGVGVMVELERARRLNRRNENRFGMVSIP